VASLLALSACGSVASTSNAFEVNGKGYSQAEFDALNADLITAGQFTATEGKIKSEDAIVVMRTLIRYEAFEQFIKNEGVTVSETDRDTVLENAGADPAFAGYPKALQDVLVNLNLADTTLKKMTPPSTDELKKKYDKSPASAGVLCLSHILVKTEADAKGVLADLDGGAKFATVAAKKSTEPGADKSGGSLANGDQACQPLADLQTSFDRDFLIGAVDAKPGVPTGPIKSSFGYHIILSQPFDEVKTSVQAVVAENPGATLLAGYMATADISVRSIYGKWNGATATIS
jgi:parvulin-like peptidyl-prolyl isomerase